MKARQSIQVFVILLGLFLSACSSAPLSQAVSRSSNAGADKPVSEVVFTGAIDEMNGDQWIIDGQPVTIAPTTLKDGDYAVGKTIKVEARVAEDGSVTAQRVEASSSVSSVSAGMSIPDAASMHTSVVPGNPARETMGTIESLTDTTITVNGQSYALVPGTEIKGSIGVGSVVKLHFNTNADGTFTVTEVSTAGPAQISGGGNLDDHSNEMSVNDDHSSSNVSHEQPGDDHGGDDHTNDDSNNDHGSGGHASDDGSNHE